jgi:hypothetical protein
MPVLPALTVVFVGLAGPKVNKAEHQIAAVLHDEARVDATHVPPRELRSLVRHDADSRDVVRSLHVDGVIAGEVTAGRRHRSLSLVVYDGDGRLKSLVQIPFSAATLSDRELDVLRSNIIDTATALAPAAPEPPEQQPPPAPPPPPPAPPPPAPPPPRAPAIAPVRAPAPPDPEPEPAAPPEPAPQHDAPPVETAAAEPDGDAVSAAEIMASTSAAASTTAVSSAPVERGLHLRAALGIGVAGRNFTPGPSTVRGYAATSSGAVRFDGEIQPAPRLQLAIAAEHSVAMTTDVAQGAADTTISRWEASAAVPLLRGAIDVAPVIGVGRRVFSIDSTDPSRTPDGDYNYVVLGLAAAGSLGNTIALRAHAAFEPVVSGAEPTEMLFGEARRWALDVGAAVELRATSHLFARIAAGYQRFAWLWSAAGARGAGGAVDSYPSGAVSVGLDY